MKFNNSAIVSGGVINGLGIIRNLGEQASRSSVSQKALTLMFSRTLDRRASLTSTNANSRARHTNREVLVLFWDLPLSVKRS